MRIRGSDLIENWRRHRSIDRRFHGNGGDMAAAFSVVLEVAPWILVTQAVVLSAVAVFILTRPDGPEAGICDGRAVVLGSPCAMIQPWLMLDTRTIRRFPFRIGLHPAARYGEVRDGTPMPQPPIRYAKSGSLNIAYQVSGSGTQKLIDIRVRAPGS